MNVLEILWVSAIAIMISYSLTEWFGEVKKPFGCAKCLSFWLGLIMFLITKDYLYIGLPYLFTKIIDKYLWS